MGNRSVGWIARGSRLLILLAAAAVVPACGNGGGGGGPSGFVLSMKGGSATAGPGNTGGYIDMEAYNGADVGVLSGGSVDLSITLPSYAAPYLGTNPLIVTADATLAVGSGPNGSSLSNASANITNLSGTVTGLWIKPGVTLTIKPNDVPTGAAAHTRVSLNFSEGVFIEGTLKVEHRDAAAEGDSGGADKADFYLQGCTSWVAGPGSVIDLSGDNNLAGAGGNGGYFYCYNTDFVQSYATLKTNGGNGSTDGGNGGNVDYESDWGSFINYGNVYANGGAGAAGIGGYAGYVQLYADDYSYCYNSGNVYAFGGTGTAGGGTGGYIYLYSSDGPIVNSGALLAYGGDATTSGNGGDGGTYIELYAYGSIRNLATLDCHGGMAAAGNGGNGGYLDFESWYGTYPYGSYEYTPDSGGMWLGGNMTTDGGNGTTGGGTAGYTYIYAEYEGYSFAHPNVTPIYLVGFSTLNNSGGDGSTNGGDAGADIYGNNYIESWYAYDSTYEVYYGGAVVSQANVISKGGNGGTGNGGKSTNWYLETEDELYLPYNYGVTNTGNWDLSGGDGGTSGGSAGYWYCWGDFYVRSTGAMVANGGKGGTGNGANGGEFDFYCRSGNSAITTTVDPKGNLNQVIGSVTVNGGSSDSGNGGTGGFIYMYGDVTAGPLSAAGGNSTTATAGNGGYVELFSNNYATTFGSVNVSPGTGATGTPTNGDLWVDGNHLVGP